MYTQWTNTILYVYIIYIFLLSFTELKVLSHLMLHFMLLTLDYSTFTQTTNKPLL